MTKSELIERLAARQTQLSSKDVELAVKTIIEHMAQTLASGERIEIRGFGSFSLHYRAPRIGRNPKTGESVGLSGKYVPHFKPGKELRERVNASMERYPSTAANTQRSGGSDDDDADSGSTPFAANAER
jgi:integration host factor subunit beta